MYSGLNIPQRKIGLFILIVQVPKDITVKQRLRKSPQVTLPCTFQCLLVNNLNIPIDANWCQGLKRKTLGKAVREVLGCPLKNNRVWLCLALVRGILGLRPLKPGDRDPVAPLKSTTGTQGNRVDPLLPNSDSRNFGCGVDSSSFNT